MKLFTSALSGSKWLGSYLAARWIKSKNYFTFPTLEWHRNKANFKVIKLLFYNFI